MALSRACCLMARATRTGAALYSVQGALLFIVGFLWCYQSFGGGAAAVAFSYFFKKKMQAAAACAAAIEGVHVSEFLSASAALALVGMLATIIWNAAAAKAAASSDGYVHESLFAIVDICHVFVSRWTILDLESYALGAVVSWICDDGLALGKEPWSVFR